MEDGVVFPLAAVPLPFAVAVVEEDLRLSFSSRLSIDTSTSSAHSPRMNPEWMAAATGSESSVYTPVPHKARRAQISSRWIASIRNRGTRIVKVQFSFPSNRGIGTGVEVYPNLDASGGAREDGISMRGA